MTDSDFGMEDKKKLRSKIRHVIQNVKECDVSDSVTDVNGKRPEKKISKTKESNESADEIVKCNGGARDWE